MALRKILVLDDDGLIQELQPGDTAEGPISEVDVVSLVNSEGATINKGQPVYSSLTGEVSLARANAFATSAVVGLVFDTTIADAAAGNIQTNGQLSLADWTAIAGAATLTTGAHYYLSGAASGAMVTSAPTGSPNVRTLIGKALSTLIMQIEIQPPVRRG